MLTVYAITRDAGGNFIANAQADVDGWTFSNLTGAVVAGDLVPSNDRKSADILGLHTGSFQVTAAIAGLTSVSTGTIIITP
jgi:hypothetical protein